MKIGLVSFTINSNDTNTAENHANFFLKFVNSYDYLNIIVFSGWTILKQDIKEIKKDIINKNSLVLFEVRDDIYNGEEMHKGYYFQNGILHDRNIVQIFSKSSEVNGNKNLVIKLLEQIKSKRIIEHKGRNICWLICGEINILKNIQKQRNKVLFRFENDSILKEKFDDLYKEINIFVNPTHTIMGNQGKLARRREYLSKDNKIFCSVSNADKRLKQKISYKSIQYCYKNEKTIDGELLYKNEDVVFKEYPMT